MDELGNCTFPCDSPPCVGVPSCLRECVASVPEGGACDPDPCIPNPLLCGPGLVCNGDVCEQPDGKGYLFCRPGEAQSRCGTGLVCRGFEDAADPAYRCEGNARQPIAPDDADGACVFPAREGSPCDSDWGEAPGCTQCEPGTECLADPTGARRCFRRCPAGPEQCECVGEPSAFDHCVDRSAAQDGTDTRCENCASHGEGCRQEDDYCCEPGDICHPPPPVCPPGEVCTAPGSTCCRAPGAVCTPGATLCCGVAGTQGVCGGGLASLPPAPPVPDRCHQCSRAGQPPDPVAGCCAGLLVGGSPVPDLSFHAICVAPCDEGAPCNPAACPGQPGHIECDPTGGTCVPDNVVEETCNGHDDNCNGLVDEGVDARYRARPHGSAPVPADDGFAGCSQPFPCEWRCIDGEERCVHRPGIDYCATRNDGDVYANGFGCFSDTSPCPNGQSDCFASETCQANPNCPDPDPFRPGGATCCYRIPACSTGTYCWSPGARSNGSCP